MSQPTSAEEQLLRLRSQINWTTRISTALSATQNPEDIISIVLAGMLAPTGLGYTRVLYFENDETSLSLRGRYALYYEDTEMLQELASDLNEEMAFIDHQASRDAIPTSMLHEEEQIESLRSSSPWIVLFQKLSPENPITSLLEQMRFPLNSREPEAAAMNLLTEVDFWRRPRVVAREAQAHRIPDVLIPTLAEHFAMVPLRTSKGLRALIIADRHLATDSTLDEYDFSELEWFARQASLAIENAEVRGDLANAYREIKQIDQMKSNFLSVISHELRTPLTALLGFVELLIEEKVGAVNDTQRSLLTRVQKNTGHLIHLVNDLIEVAEIEAEGTAEVRISPVEPLAVLLDTLPRLEQQRREKKVRIAPCIDGDIPRILGDERALGRIFFHLIDNAIKFSPDNSTVEVRFRTSEDELHIDVCDHGMGIPREHIKKIFRQFYQVDNTLTRGHEGLGLGLAITRMLVTATHGRIEVDSEVGQGSTFTISYPVYTRMDVDL